MKTKTLAIFGGSQEQTYLKQGKKHGCDVLFHCGKKRNGGNEKEFRSLINKADAVVVLLGACGHVSMDMVKSLSKELDKPFGFVKGFGASGAIKKGLELCQAC
jgi:hypothetical protein